MEILEKEYAFFSNDKKIYARALIPNIDYKVPLVIFSHGFGGNHDEQLYFQKEMAINAIAIFSFDFSGGSTHSIGKSEGKIEEMSVITEVRNLIDAYEFSSQLDFVNKEKIYLVGASQGGVVSTLAAKELSDKIAALYLLYPAFSLFNDTKQRFDKKEDIPETFNLMGITVGKKYFLDIYEINIFDTLKIIQMPTYIFHGTNDKLVPISFSEKATRCFPNATFIKLKGSGHGFNIRVQKEIARFISQKLHN